MAGNQKAVKTFVFDLKVNDNNILEEIRKKYKLIEAEGKNGINFKANVDDKGVVSFIKEMNALKANEKNDLILHFNKEASMKSLGLTEEAMIAKVESIVKKLQSIMNGAALGGYFGGDKSPVDNSTNEKIAQVDNLNKKLQEQTKIYNEQKAVVSELDKKLQSQKNINQGKLKNDLLGSYKKYSKGYDDADTKTFNKLEKQFQDAFKNYVAGSKDDATFSKLSNDKDLIDEITTGFSLTKGNNVRDDNLYENDTKYKQLAKQWAEEGFGKSPSDKGNDSEISNIEKQLASAKKTQSNAQKEISSLKGQIRTLNTEIKVANLESEDKSTRTNEKGEDTSKKGSTKNSSKEESATQGSNTEDNNIVESSKPIPISINPSNLDEFYGKIENHKIADIKVDVDEADLKNKLDNIQKKYSTADTKTKTEDGDIWDGISKDKQSQILNIQKQINSNKGKKDTDLYSEIGNLLKDTVDSKKPMGDKELAKLVGLSKSYKQKSKKESPVSDFLKASGVKDWDEIIPGYSELKNQYETVAKRQAKKDKIVTTKDESSIEEIPKEVNINVKLDIDPIEISSLKGKIESGIGKINIDIADNNSKQEPEKITDEYANAKAQLKELIELQKTAKNGNPDLLPTYSETGKNLTTAGIAEEDIKGKSVTKKSLQKMVAEYNDAFKKAQNGIAINESLGKDKATNLPEVERFKAASEQLKLYTASYSKFEALQKNADSKLKIDEKAPDSWATIVSEINNAKNAQEAYLQVGEKTKSLFAEMSKVSGKTFDGSDVKGLEQSIMAGKGENKFNELIGSESSVSVKKLATDMKELGASSGTVGTALKESLSQFDIEANGIEATVTTLRSAIESISTSFDKATQDVSEGATKQITDIDKIGDAVTKLANSLETAGVKNVNQPVDTAKELAKIQKEKDALEKLKASISKQQTESDKSDTTSKKAVDTNYKTQVFNAANKTDGFDVGMDSFKESKNGVIEFTAAVKQSDGTVKQMIYSFTELNQVMTAAGKIRQSFIKSGEMTSNTKEVDADEKDYLKKIEARRRYEAADHPTTSYADVSAKQQKLLQEELAAEEKLNASIERNNLSEEKRKEIQDAITAAKKEEIALYSGSDKLVYQNEKKVENVTSKVDLDNYEGDTKVQLESLMNKTQEYLNLLRTGSFEDKTVFDEIALKAEKATSKIKELASENNMITNKKGTRFAQLDLDSSLEDTSAKKIEAELKKKLASENQKVENVSYKPSSKTATANVINDGQIKKVTMSLRECQGELGKTSVEVRKLEGAMNKSPSAGGKWIDGFKNKIHSLTQYITGLDVVMRAWNEIKQGFNFVKELDSSLTTINQTMSATSGQLKELGASSISMGKELGSSAQNVLDAVAIYANANETTDSILQKAQPTVMLANASGAGTATAADQIQGVVQQFDELEGQERRVVNSYEKISAGLAIDFAKILAHKLEIIY